MEIENLRKKKKKKRRIMEIGESKSERGMLEKGSTCRGGCGVSCIYWHVPCTCPASPAGFSHPVGVLRHC